MTNLFDLTGKTALITGGGGLLGPKHAEAIVEYGGKVILADWHEDRAKEITNDKQHCKQIARENSNLVSNFSFWFMSPQAETKYTSLYRKCLINRGHSVLN